ncbi:607_t:CDS:2, partial [Acaulospora colombiana]
IDSTPHPSTGCFDAFSLAPGTLTLAMDAAAPHNRRLAVSMHSSPPAIAHFVSPPKRRAVDCFGGGHHSGYSRNAPPLILTAIITRALLRSSLHVFSVLQRSLCCPSPTLSMSYLLNAR